MAIGSPLVQVLARWRILFPCQQAFMRHSPTPRFIMNESINPYAPPTSVTLSVGREMPGNGEIMSRAWQLYRRHFGIIAVTICVIWVPCEVLSSYMDAFVFGEDDFRKSFKLVQFLENFFGIIATAGVIHVALHDGAGGVTSALSCGLKRWPSMWWARFASTMACLLAFVLLVVPFFYLYPRLMLVESALVSEGLTGMQAINRSQQLVRGHYWQVVRLLLWLCLFLAIPIVLVIVLSTFEVLPDHWQLDALTSVIVDVASGYGTVCFFCLYQALASHEVTKTA